MKTCKNCKKQIPNNAKTCKYCKKSVKSQATLQRKKTIVKQASLKTTTTQKTSKKNHYMHIIEDGKKRLEEEKQKKMKQRQKKTQKELHNQKPEKIFANTPKKITRPLKQKNKNLDQTKSKNTLTVKKEKPIVEKKLTELSKKEEVGKIEKEAKKNGKKFTTMKIKNIPMQKKVILVVLIVLSLFFLFCGIKWMQKLTNTEPAVKITQKNYGQVFKMNEKIEYQGIKYQVIDVERSSGTAYKTPKKGYEFIVVTIKLENDTEEKQKYNNKSWRLTNSKGEETSKIFIPIKDHSTLYSGSLVVGAQKTGSLVFEQPKEDPDLQLNFYDASDVEQQDIMDSDKKLEKVFAFKIKVNENKEAEIKR